jgi:hypothetical protein
MVNKKTFIIVFILEFLILITLIVKHPINHKYAMIVWGFIGGIIIAGIFIKSQYKNLFNLIAIAVFIIFSLFLR